MQRKKFSTLTAQIIIPREVYNINSIVSTSTTTGPYHPEYLFNGGELDETFGTMILARGAIPPNMGGPEAQSRTLRGELEIGPKI